MTDDLYENLVEMYNSFFNEQQELKEKLENNLNTLEQIDCYIKSLFEKEDNDFKYFSPRDVSSVYKENIEKKECEKNILNNENQYYYKKINQLDLRIQTINSILSSLKQLNSEDKNNINKNLYILDIQEKERQRIARDLHDTSLQNLAHLVHKIELTSMYIDQDPVKAKLELQTVNMSLKSTIQEIRNTIFDLRPMSFDDLGLKESFERLIDRLRDNTEFNIKADIEEIQLKNSLFLMTIFRIVEECLNNAVKHSNGSYLYFSLKSNDKECNIVIKDDGKSFDYNKALSVKDRHFGLTILKERIELLSGKLNIITGSDIGTTIKITIPLYNIEQEGE